MGPAFWMLALSGVAAASSDTLIWGGIDYGLVRCVGTGDFREPEAIFPGYFTTWNALFVEEYLPVLKKRARVDTLPTDLDHLKALHEAADPATQIVRDDLFDVEERLDPEVVRARVKAYTLDKTEGTLFTLVADQLHKPSQQGCFWAVSMDIASRRVLTMSRTCESAHGIGFRNYWFGSVKDLIDHLPKGGP